MQRRFRARIGDATERLQIRERNGGVVGVRRK
jgi:hypothetical protein